MKKRNNQSAGGKSKPRKQGRKTARVAPILPQQLPAQPEVTVATTNDYVITVFWKNGPFCDKYQVSWGKVKNAPDNHLPITTHCSADFLKKDFEKNVDYWVQVKGINSKGDGPWSEPKLIHIIDNPALGPTAQKQPPRWGLQLFIVLVILALAGVGVYTHYAKHPAASVPPVIPSITPTNSVPSVPPPIVSLTTNVNGKTCEVIMTPTEMSVRMDGKTTSVARQSGGTIVIQGDNKGNVNSGILIISETPKEKQNDSQSSSQAPSQSSMETLEQLPMPDSTTGVAETNIWLEPGSRRNFAKIPYCSVQYQCDCGPGMVRAYGDTIPAEQLSSGTLLSQSIGFENTAPYRISVRLIVCNRHHH
jgi:hypothetical protein